jgi:hypothetical protein
MNAHIYTHLGKEVDSVEGVVQEKCWALDMRVRYPLSFMTWVECS